MKKELLSIIVNCYNEEETIDIFYKTIVPIVKKINDLDYELIFIDDCSSDKTLEIIRSLAKKDNHVKYLSTTRRFGKEAGILAGYEKAKGDYLVSIDVDLQDPPELIEEMYNKIKKDGYDCVATRSVSRHGYSFFRKLFTAMYYFILKILTPLEMKEGIRDYRMVSKRVAKDIINMHEYNRYSRYLFAYLGYKTYWIEFDNKERVAGTTKWNFGKLFGVALEAILTSSVTLLYLPIVLGIINLILAIIFTILVIIFTSSLRLFILMIAFYLLTVIMFVCGVTNLYLSRMYLEIKGRPNYIVAETEEDL